jgi:adhesin transport system outer membrane protein
MPAAGTTTPSPPVQSSPVAPIVATPVVATPRAAAPIVTPSSVVTTHAVVTATAVPVSPASSSTGMTLQEAVGIGLQKSPDYGQAAQDTLAAKQVTLQAMGLNLPAINAQGETGEDHTKYIGIPPANQDMWHNRGSLSLSQLLFDGWGTWAQIHGQKARAESAANHAGEIAEFSSLDSTQAFLDVLRQRQLLQIARSNVETHLKILDTINAGAQAGTMTDGDVAQIRARLAFARATVASSEENLRQAETLFAQKIGDMPGSLVEPDVPRSRLQPTVNDAVAEALLRNPTLQVTKTDIKATEADQVGADSLMYPHIDIEANGAVGDDIAGVPGNNQAATVLAVARWNLYHGGADQARIRETAYRTASAKEHRRQTLLQVEKDTRDTWAAMTSADDRSRDYAEQATANEKVVSVYLDQFTIGRRTLLDVLDAQNELFIARSNSIDALYAAKFAVYRVLALEGHLLDTLNIPQPLKAILNRH